VGSYKIQGRERGAPNEAALKALAIILRTRALELLGRVAANAHYDLTDSLSGVQYFGVNAESPQALLAADGTRGITLNLNQPAELHDACGGSTNVADDDEGQGNLSAPEPSAQRALISEAPGNLLCAPEDPTRWAVVNWTIAIDAQDIQRRAKRDYPQIGSVRALRPLRRTPDGSLLALELGGSRGSVVLEGLDNISALLGPGALRSPKFKLLPLYLGGTLSEVIIRGKGTGHLRGLCLAGAQGMGEDGKTYREILAHYFPGSALVLTDYATGEKKPLPDSPNPPSPAPKAAAKNNQDRAK